MNILSLLEQLKAYEAVDAHTLHLTAYENVLSETARRWLSSPLGFRYYFGGGQDRVVDFDPFNLQGIPEIATLLSAAEAAMCRMLSAQAVNLKCLSGIHALTSLILAVSDAGETVMILAPKDGGHNATEHILTRAGRKYCYLSIKPESQQIDVEATVSTIDQHRCTKLILDMSYGTEPYNLAELRGAVGKNFLIIYDASHTLGLIAGGLFQKPLLEGADIISGNTHKTFPGPQKAIFAFRSADLAKRVDDMLNMGLVSSAHTHHLIALAITILEMEAFGKDYAKAVVDNANAFGKILEQSGHTVRKHADIYTRSHQVHLFTDDADRREMFGRLIRNNITVNCDRRIDDKIFIRFGLQDVTRRGMEQIDVEQAASFVNSALTGKDVAVDVTRFMGQFDRVHYSFDHLL